MQLQNKRPNHSKGERAADRKNLQLGKNKLLVLQTEGRFNGGNKRVEEEAGGKGEDAGGCKPADELRTGRDEAKRQVH